MSTEAGDHELVFIESPWSTPCLVLNGYMYNCHSKKSNKQYWRCHNYSKKVHEMRCRSRCVLENGRLKSITGGLHNHQPHTEKIKKIVQRNKLASVGVGRKLPRPSFKKAEEPRQVGAASMQFSDSELMPSLMLMHN